jgi:shikimate 5-dehydrogenase
MSVLPDELDEFLILSCQLGIKGLSVTIPLKEKILSFPCINTLRFEDKLYATNTDGLGALDVLGDVAGKNIVILGAGGTAKAISAEATCKGAYVFILNRSCPQKLATLLGCSYHIPSSYDIVINCTPVAPSFPFLPNTLAMDVVYFPKVTKFLKEATLAGCHVIYGEEMYRSQALRQTQFWLDKASFPVSKHLVPEESLPLPTQQSAPSIT